MDNMHPVMQQALSAFIPSDPSFNDDDIYVIDVLRKKIIHQYGASSAAAAYAKSNGEILQLGQALVTGLQAKWIMK